MFTMYYSVNIVYMLYILQYSLDILDSTVSDAPRFDLNSSCNSIGFNLYCKNAQIADCSFKYLSG